jgi:hypothetical protein
VTNVFPAVVAVKTQPGPYTRDSLGQAGCFADGCDESAIRVRAIDSKLGGREQSSRVSPIGTNDYGLIRYALQLITFGWFFGCW